MSDTLPVNTEGGSYIRGNVYVLKGDFINRDKIIYGDEIHGDKIIHGDEIHIVIYQSSTDRQLHYRDDVADILKFHTEIYIAREQEKQVVDFTNQPESGYLLLEAEAGFGKSAFVANLVNRYTTNHCDREAPLTLIYFFARSERDDNSPVHFLQAVNSQLLQHLNCRLGQTQKIPEGVPSDLISLRTQFNELWHVAGLLAKPERPLLLLVDGLDENIELAAELPRTLFDQSYIRVVATSRPSPDPRSAVNLEHPFKRAAELTLEAFQSADINSLLRKHKERGQAEAPNEQQIKAWSPRILAATGGQPLFARFVCEDVVRGGEITLAYLENRQPKGVEEYFVDQLEKLLEEQKANGLIKKILGILLAAYDGLTSNEIADVLEQDLIDVGHAIQPIHRYFIGETKLTFMHSYLRRAVQKQFSRRENQRYKRTILNWCESYQEEEWPDDTPDYIFSYYAQHLAEADQSEELYRLIDKRWMELKLAQSGSLYSFAQDVDLAIKTVCPQINQDNLTKAIKLYSLAVTLDAVVTNIPLPMLRMLVRAQEERLAQDYATLIHDPEQRCLAYLAIAAELIRQEKTTQAVQLISKVQGIMDSSHLQWEHIDDLCDVADIARTNGENRPAKQLAQLAADLLPTSTVYRDDFYDKYASYMKVAATQIRLGEIRPALNTLQRADQLQSNRLYVVSHKQWWDINAWNGAADVRDIDEALGYLVKEFLQSNDSAGWYRLKREILQDWPASSPAKSAAANVQIALGLLAANQIEDAKEFVQDAFNYVGRSLDKSAENDDADGDSHVPKDLLTKLPLLFAQVENNGLMEQCLSYIEDLLRSAPGDYGLTEGIYSLIEAAIAIGLAPFILTLAERLLSLMQDGLIRWWRNDIFCELAVSLVHSGHRQVAETIAMYGLLDDRNFEKNYIHHFDVSGKLHFVDTRFSILAKAKDLDWVVDLAQSLPPTAGDFRSVDNCLHTVAITLIEQGEQRFVQEELLERLQDGDERDSIVGLLVPWLVHEGSFVQALMLTDQIQHTAEKANALLEIAKGLKVIGVFSGAIEIAKQISSRVTPINREFLEEWNEWDTEILYVCQAVSLLADMNQFKDAYAIAKMMPSRVRVHQQLIEYKQFTIVDTMLEIVERAKGKDDNIIGEILQYLVEVRLSGFEAALYIDVCCQISNCAHHTGFQKYTLPNLPNIGEALSQQLSRAHQIIQQIKIADAWARIGEQERANRLAEDIVRLIQLPNHHLGYYGASFDEEQIIGNLSQYGFFSQAFTFLRAIQKSCRCPSETLALGILQQLEVQLCQPGKDLQLIATLYQFIEIVNSVPSANSYDSDEDRSTNNETQRASFGRLVAWLCANRNDLKLVRDLLMTMHAQYRVHYDDALHFASVALARREDFTSALDILRVDFQQPAELLPKFDSCVINRLVEVANELDQATATKFVKVAVRSMLILPEWTNKSALLQKIFNALLEVDQHEYAIEVAASMPNRQRVSSFTEHNKVAALMKLIDLDWFEAVWEIAQDMPNRKPKADILRYLLRSLENKEHGLQKGNVAQQLLDAALGEQTKKNSPRLLSNTACVLSETGNFELALDATKAISETNDKVMSLLMTVYDIAEAKVENLHSRIISLWASVNLNQLVWDNYSDYTWDVMRPLFITSLAKINDIDLIYTHISQLHDTSVRATCIDIFLRSLLHNEQFPDAIRYSVDAWMKASDINDKTEKANVQRSVVHVLTEVNEFERAWQYAEDIQDNWRWSSAITDLLTAIVMADNIESVDKMVDTTSNERKNQVYNNLSAILSKHGNYTLAIEVTKKISDGQIRLCACGNVYANILPRVKETHLATVVSKIIDLSEQIHNDSDKEAILARSALILARTGHIEDALTMVLLVKPETHDLHYDEVMTIIVSELIQTRNINALIQLAKWFAHGRGGLDSLNDVVDAFANDDGIGKCKELLNTIIKETQNSRDEFVRNHSLHKLVQILLEINDIEDVLDVVQTLKNDSEIWISVAKKLVFLGFPERALKLAETKSDGEATTAVLTGVAAGFAEMGEYSQALKVVESIPKIGHQVEAISTMMNVMTKADDLHEIERMANVVLTKISSIEDNETRMWRVFTILPLLLQSRLWKHSLDAALRIGDHGGRGEALRDLVVALGQSQDLPSDMQSLIYQVYEAANVLTDKRWEAAIISLISQIFAKMGDYNSSLGILHNIDERSLRLQTLEGFTTNFNSIASEQEQWSILAHLLDEAKPLGRDGILSVIYALIPWLADLDQGQTLWQIYDDIQELENWWERSNDPFTQPPYV